MEDEPECYNGYCESHPGERGITSCKHCGGQLEEVNGFWYHHSQFNDDGTLISPYRPQDVVH